MPTNRVLLMGQPGAGKSFLLRKIALDWSSSIVKERDNEATELATFTSKEEHYFVSQFNIVLLIELNRVKTGMTFEDILRDQLLSARDAKFVAEYIHQNQDDCLILLDAWDEHNQKVTNKIFLFENKGFLDDVNILITSRILNQEILHKAVDRRSLLIGFSKESIQSFFSSVVPDEPHSNIKSLIEGKDNKITEFLSVPLFAHYFCVIGMKYAETNFSLTNTFIKIVQLLVGYSTGCGQPFVTRCSLGTKRRHLLRIGKLAFEGLVSQHPKSVFTQSDVTSLVSSDTLGLLLPVHASESSDLVDQLFAFHHKMMQEFMAALYIAHHGEALEFFIETLYTGYHIEEYQFVILFVCGLSPTFGGPTVSSKIDSNQLNSAKMCPLLNRWAFSVQTMDSNMLAACIATADVEQSLFQMKCCAEMFIGSATDGPGFSNFPGGRHEFRFPATCDFLQIPLEIMPFMIHDKFISFKPKSIAFQVRNMIVTESNINKFREVSKFIMNTDSYYFINEMSNIKCDHQVDHVDNWLTNLSVLLCCNLVNVSLCKKDMSILMEQLGSCIQIRSLIMHQVSSENLHRELPRHLPKFSRLNDLVLSAIEVPTGQEILCQAVGKLKLLPSLALCQMDLSEAGNALGATVECLSGLDCLDLHKSNLTEQQVVQVAQAIRKNCAYISNLDLSDNSAVGNSYQAVCECIKHLDFLLTIGVQNCQMTFHGLWQTLQSLPTSIVFIFAAGNEVDKDSTETMDFFLKQHPNIKYISLGVKEMNANNREFIKNMFDEVNAQAFLVYCASWGSS